MLRIVFIKLIFVLVFQLFQSSIVVGQQTIYDEATLLYKKEITGGIHLHGHGGGIFFRKSKQKTAEKHHSWNIEMVTMKHPKEDKRYHATSENSKASFLVKKTLLFY